MLGLVRGLNPFRSRTEEVLVRDEDFVLDQADSVDIVGRFAEESGFKMAELRRAEAHLVELIRVKQEELRQTRVVMRATEVELAAIQKMQDAGAYRLQDPALSPPDELRGGSDQANA